MAGATKLSEMDNGAEFTKCISITDFQGKTLSDDITLIDRESGGCCPKGSVPGQKWYNNYKGAQVVCGFKADGSVALSTGSSGGAKTCTYNKCYVDKQDLTCADDSKQLLNGCCKKTTATKDGSFPAQCLNYYYNFNNAYSEKVNYCLTYDKDYGKKGRAGTSAKTDDQADGKLVPSKISTYTPLRDSGRLSFCGRLSFSFPFTYSSFIDNFIDKRRSSSFCNAQHGCRVDILRVVRQAGIEETSS
jgi:hypothetical protein